jgi:hypothetical protein
MIAMLAIEILDSGKKASMAIIPKVDVLPAPHALKGAFYETEEWKHVDDDRIVSVPRNTSWAAW